MESEITKKMDGEIKKVCDKFGYTYKNRGIYLNGDKRYNVELSGKSVFIHEFDMTGSDLIRAIMEIKI